MDCTVCFRLRDEHHLYSKHSSSALHVLAVVRQQHNMKHVFEPASQAYYDLSTFPLQKFTDSAPKIKPIGIYYFFLWKRSAIQSEPRNVEIRTKRILLYIRFCAEARMPHPKLYAGPKPNPVFKPHPVLKANARSKQNLNLNEIQNRSNSRMDLDESNTTLSSVLR